MSKLNTTGATAVSVANELASLPTTLEEHLQQKYEEVNETMRLNSQHNTTQEQACVDALWRLIKRHDLSEELKIFFKETLEGFINGTMSTEGNEWLPVIFGSHFAVYMMPNNNGYQRIPKYEPAYVFRVWDDRGITDEIDIRVLAGYLAKKENASTMEGIVYNMAYHACHPEMQEIDEIILGSIDSCLIVYAQLALASRVLEQGIGNGGNIITVHGAKH